MPPRAQGLAGLVVGASAWVPQSPSHQTDPENPGFHLVGLGGLGNGAGDIVGGDIWRAPSVMEQVLKVPTCFQVRTGTGRGQGGRPADHARLPIMDTRFSIPARQKVVMLGASDLALAHGPRV